MQLNVQLIMLPKIIVRHNNVKSLKTFNDTFDDFEVDLNIL